MVLTKIHYLPPFSFIEAQLFPSANFHGLAFSVDINGLAADPALLLITLYIPPLRYSPHIRTYVGFENIMISTPICANL